MKVHEYQAKDLLKAAGVAVPDGIVVTTPEEAAEAFDKLGGGLIVVKAQVHAGGRGKGIAIGPDDDRGEALEIASGLKPRKEGMAKGVQLVRSKEDARRAASELLGKTLVTYQTGADRADDQEGARHRRPRHRQGALPRPGRRPRACNARS